MEIVPGRQRRAGRGRTTVYYLVQQVAAVTGRDLRSARPSLDENNRPAVSFTLNTEGAPQVRRRHRREHRPPARDHPRRPRAVGADDRTAASRPTGASPAASRRRKSQNLSLILRSGALPASLTYLEERTIGPTPRRRLDPRRRHRVARRACCWSSSFMLVYYKLSGVNAVVALVFNLIILLGLMAYIGAVMTLPGIAGFVLTMGMGVDSNVLIFERIKEELEAQRGVRAVDQRRLQPRLPDAASTRTSRRSSRRRSCSSSAPGRSAASRSRCSSACCRTCSPRPSCRRRCSSWRWRAGSRSRRLSI